MTMKIFTVCGETVKAGVLVETLALKAAGVEIPAVVVGEEGRGRLRGVLPVQLTPDQMKVWQEKKVVWIFFAEVGKTQAGKPKLFAKADSEIFDERALCVFRTTMGYRGSNAHTGDRAGEEEVTTYWGKETQTVYAPFPGEIIVKGVIAEGDAGRMGSGEQLIAVMPKGVFRTAYGGRLYGSPSAHYYCWNGQQMVGGLTWDERQASDLF